MKASTILVLETNVGTTFPIDATSIECFGVFGGVTFVRTKTGLQHLIKGDVESHYRAWQAAVDGYEIIDVEVVSNRSSVIGSQSEREQTAEPRLSSKPKLLTSNNQLLTSDRKPKSED